MFNGAAIQERANWTEGISYQVQFLADLLPEAQRWVLGANCNGRRWSQEFSGSQRYAETDIWLKKNLPKGVTVGVFLGDIGRRLENRWPKPEDYVSVPLIAVGSFDPHVWKRLMTGEDAPCAIWQDPNELWVIVWRLARPVSHLDACRIADDRARRSDARRVDIPLLPDCPEAVQLLRKEEHRAPSWGFRGTGVNARGGFAPAAPSAPQPVAQPAPGRAVSQPDVRSRQLQEALTDFGISARVVDVQKGPSVSMFAVALGRGVRQEAIDKLAKNIARMMGVAACRVCSLPGRPEIGIELPNTTREPVLLKDFLASSHFRDHPAKLALALGKTIGGEPVITDLARMPHLLIAGTTGSGKSVAINCLILSLLHRLSPKECRFIMVDPKELELSVYEGIPHLLRPVVTEPKEAIAALKWAVKEMRERYKDIKNLGRARNLAEYNARVPESERKPIIVIVIDEMEDLMMTAGKDVEDAARALSRLARAAGIHLVMATQRPSVDVITGGLKANFPYRIAFAVPTRHDSQTILGMDGAEQLQGAGDMLYMPGGQRLERLQAPFVDVDEVCDMVDRLKEQGEPDYVYIADTDAQTPAGVRTSRIQWLSDDDVFGSGDSVDFGDDDEGQADAPIMPSECGGNDESGGTVSPVAEFDSNSEIGFAKTWIIRVLRGKPPVEASKTLLPEAEKIGIKRRTFYRAGEALERNGILLRTPTPGMSDGDLWSLKEGAR